MADSRGKSERDESAILKICKKNGKFNFLYRTPLIILSWKAFYVNFWVSQTHGKKNQNFDPLGQPKVGIIVLAHVVRPSVRPHFSNVEKRNNRKQCSLLSWLWVWPSGSLMTPVLSSFFSKNRTAKKNPAFSFFCERNFFFFTGNGLRGRAGKILFSLVRSF